MGLAEDVGKALARTTENLSTLMTDKMKNVARDTVSQAADYRSDAIKKMNDEVAVHSIDPTMFKSKEMQEIVVELKKRLQHSPENTTDWFDQTLSGVFQGLYAGIVDRLADPSMKTSADAEAQAGALMVFTADVIILISVLDLIATACSFTLIRNIVHIGQLFMSTFGLDRLSAATIAPALDAGLVPLLRQGWNDKFRVMIPGPSDLVRFQLREAFDELRRKELLQEGTSATYIQNMGKQGYNEFWSDSFWASHWELPSVTQLNEMLHRRVIDQATWDRFVKYNDFDPTVRPWLRAISYNPYTRVDVRRMWELALLSDDEVLSNYMDQGYDEDHARRMTIWTKVYTMSVELRARYGKGWITEDDILRELINAGMPSERAKIWVQRIVKAEKETRTIAERDITKSEIVKGVKKELLSTDDGISLLTDMGYSAEEAEYIIAVNVEALSGSPQTFTEFKRLVDFRRKSQGLQVKEALPALVEIDAELKRLYDIEKRWPMESTHEMTSDELDAKIKDLQQQSRALRKK